MIETNASDVAGRIADLADEIDKKSRQEMERAVLEAEQIAKQIVAVESGDLRDSIEGDTQDLVLKAGGPDAPYAVLVHEGTRDREPQPFLERAAIAAAENAARRLRQQ